MGRVGWVQGTRVSLALVAKLARMLYGDASKVAAHYGWPLWQAESALAFIREYPDMVAREEADHDEAGEDSLDRLLPGIIAFPHR